LTIVIVTGLIARFPVGGNTWSYLQYVIGLKRLGFDVYYLEDSVDLLCYNPEANMTDTDCSYCVNYLDTVMKDRRVNMEDNWAYRVGNECYGMSERELVRLCKETEVLINVSGSVLLYSWLKRKEYEDLDKTVFIDTDPAITQFNIANDSEGNEQGTKSFYMHDLFFTFGENVGESDCEVPDCGVKWNKTRQPIVLDMWQPRIESNLENFTTFLSWRPDSTISYKGVTYGHKDVELRKFIDLPKLTGQKIELAISGGLRPEELLEHKWNLVSGIAEERRDMWTYQDYIQRSRAEWSVAKSVYVETWCGWFSERSACYLASAKPVLIQDTGFSKYLPVGEGLMIFNNLDEIIKGIDSINNDYAAHCESARYITKEYFDSDIVLRNLLNESRI
jgi:hypothetical protein